MIMGLFQRDMAGIKRVAIDDDGLRGQDASMTVLMFVLSSDRDISLAPENG